MHTSELQWWPVTCFYTEWSTEGQSKAPGRQTKIKKKKGLKVKVDMNQPLLPTG